MQITLIRPKIEDVPYTIGTLYINDNYFCDTLEDYDRELYQDTSLDVIKAVKIKHQTAIPYGTYQVVMSYSNRFGKYLPELLGVPGFDGIRIHSGNTQADTSGCILVGQKELSKIINSRLTYNKLSSLIQSVQKKEKIFITIKPTLKSETV